MANTAADQPLPSGQPGIPPRWTAGAKTAVGRSADEHSRVWFTIARGIVSEVYYPMTDQANSRDLGFLVADGLDFFSEEQRHTIQQIAALVPGVPGYRIISTCGQGRYRIAKTIVTEPGWDALVQQIQFESLQGRMIDYGLYALLAPHIANRGAGNCGWAGEYKGIPMLFAERASTTLALACSVPFRAVSCGYVGVSDGWQDISRHKRMTFFHSHAPDGNIALTGQIDLAACDGRFTLVLAFGRTAAGFVPIKNRPPGESDLPAVQIVSPDALALVRFGLRAPDDPRIVNTVMAIDALLKSETTTGPVWHRYDGDGYGEHADGSAFDGTGIGRGWPLLAGERAHYELAAGRCVEAVRLLRVMAAQASDGGMLPEQVWDAPDIPERGLFNGRPTGAAMPLVWAHAEYIKLVRSLRDGQVFDLPPQPVQRYQLDKVPSRLAIWRFNQKCRRLATSKTLRIETLTAARVRWSLDDWRTVYDTPTRDTGLGVHVADLATADLPPGATARFTFFWPGAGHWEGVDFEVLVERDDDLAADHAWITPGL